MAMLPEIVLKAWESRTAPIVFTTVDTNGIPNSIYASCAWIFDSQTIIVADNYFDKTLKNIQNGSKGSILFITEEKKSYQIKGSIEYHKSGKIFDKMKELNRKDLPGNAAAALKVEEVYSGSKKY